jgi:hypothetical protein
VTSPHVDLLLPESERALLRSLLARWDDLLYAPGPGLTSPLDPDAYRSSVVIVPARGAVMRVSSVVAPAFGTDLCRIQVEVLPQGPAASLGSFFDLSRTGRVYTLTPERGATAAARAPDRAEWRYGGASLAPALGRVRGLRLLREHGRGESGSWSADRGLAMTGADGVDRLLLSVADPAESALFLPVPGLYRTLLDPAAPPPPGATARDLLGHGDRDVPVEVTVEALDP